MTGFLALLSSLIWWVLFGSIGAVLPSAIAWIVLRWSEGAPVVFNRTYLACLIWSLLTLLIGASAAAHVGITRPPLGPLLASGAFRISLVLSMLMGVVALWRLIPRVDARRIRIGSACVAVAVVMAVVFGIATTLVSA
ncbi:hypothetical protein [Dyella nitratireducens]|uniref:Uncharacterized protein n=1 Tax=Dyella nitratireducens TaxID=1849580 RepID=A0ABQ1FQG7_9GAMM|nr:hypothetical protein [Dyella nitratireducens]GGA24193.1 hypothetical protein GCM10010981_10770 [Dyella nitratireducens]GLQ43860.1 hypothetical protein GCM10007902_37100 [Dyella nitratireducens]